MNLKNSLSMLLLAALWGASFLFLRLATPAFGPVALVALRIGIGGSFLMLIAIFQGKLPELWAYKKPLFLLSIIQTAIPFTLFGMASITVPAGILSVLNGTSPLWTAIIAAVWLKEYLTWDRIAGLLLGFLGVCLLVLSVQNIVGTDDIAFLLLPVIATFHYGVGASFTKKYLMHLSPMTTAAGSIFGASFITTPLAYWFWPDPTPTDLVSWGSAMGLAVLCTSAAFIIFFRLVQSIGAVKTVSVTFLVPVFGIIWGAMLLGESISWQTGLASLIILCSMALSMGLYQRARTLFR